MRTDMLEVVDALCAVQKGVPCDRSMGICDNVECLLVDEDGYGLPGYGTWLEHRRKAFEVWDEYSGMHVFPVYDPSAPGTSAEQFQNHSDTGTLWEGVQGELRQDLLDHLIKYFTDRLEGASV